MGSDSSNKRKQFRRNTIEILRQSAQSMMNPINEELVKPISKDVLKKLLGIDNYHTEIEPGGSIEMKEMLESGSGNEAAREKIIAYEKRLLEEERVYVDKRTNELRLQIKGIHEEIIKVAEVTPNLSQEVDVAAFAAPGDPGVYEFNFLQQLFETIRDFRMKIENASVWLAACNNKARKRNMWGANYKKHGAKYLLSSEHYLSRSAA